MNTTLGVLAILASLGLTACLPAAAGPTEARVQHHAVPLSGVMQYQSQLGVYAYTLTIRAGGRRVPDLVILVDGLTGWALVSHTAIDASYAPRVPGEPQGTCAGDDLPRLLFHTRTSAAWSWGGAWSLRQCTATILLTPRELPLHPLTVYTNLSKRGQIDPDSRLGRL